ncbi:hypothetical protein J6590_022653, partial [Homalodisca vitripennis]
KVECHCRAAPEQDGGGTKKCSDVTVQETLCWSGAKRDSFLSGAGPGDRGLIQAVTSHSLRGRLYHLTPPAPRHNFCHFPGT